MSGIGTRGTRLTVPQRDALMVLVLLPLVAAAGTIAAWAAITYGIVTIAPLVILLLGLGVFAMVGLRLAFLLMVLSLAFPLRSQALWEGVDIHTTYPLIILVGILVGVQLAYGRLRLPRGFLPPLLLVFFGGVVAALAGPDPDGSLVRLAAGIGLPALVGIAAAALIKPERDLGAVANAIAIALCGMGLLALLQLSGAAPVFLAPIDFGNDRVNGLFYHPNIFAAVLAACVVLLAGLAAYRGRAGLYLLIPIGLGIAGLVATLSRGPILGLLAGILLVMLLLAKRRPASLLAVVVIVPLIAVFAVPEAPTDQSSALGERFSEAFDPDAEEGRKAIWSAAEEGIEAYPLTGMGTLTFASTFTQTGSTQNVDVNVTHAHNLFLEGYLSLGPVGMIGLAWLVIGAIVRLWRASGALDAKGRIIGGFGLGAIGALFSLVVSSMVDFPYWQIEVTAFAFLLIGAAYAIGARYDARGADEEDAKTSSVRSRNASVASV